MSEWTEKQLNEVTEFASQLLSPRQVAIAAEIDWQAFNEDYEGEGALFIAYQKGYLKRQANIRKSILDLAEAGSAPAQELAIKLLKDTNTRI